MEQNFHEQLTCPICSCDSKLIDKVATINPVSALNLELRECVTCRHWWHNPMPSQKYLSSLYENSSEFVVPAGYKNVMQVEPRDVLFGFNEWLYLLEKDIYEKRCLEIGVGGGHLFRFLQAKGFECHGIEPGNWAPSQSIFPDIDTVPYDNYNFFILSDVLEHLESPVDMLIKLKSMAAENARIYCSFPNKDSLPAKLFNGKWRMVRPLGHLHYFSRQSVTALFLKSGWEIKEIQEINEANAVNFRTVNLKKIVSRIIDIPKYWKDQFWARAGMVR
jgi:2-polyprenyl-3-methyl-5-hydroxy-6-metoxy-1,4-benzoquinol methylase